MENKESSSEYWDSRYRQEDIPWDKGDGAPPLAEFLAESSFGGRVLVPGCGYGHDVRLLARHGASSVGLDLSPSALTKARGFEPVGNEEYVSGDFFRLDEALRGTFEGVFEHTCFCAIHPSMRGDYVKAVAGALKEGGKLLAIFFVKIEDPDGPPYPVSSEEIDGLFDPLFETEKQWTPSKSFPGREGREQMRLMRKL